VLSGLPTAGREVVLARAGGRPQRSAACWSPAGASGHRGWRCPEGRWASACAWPRSSPRGSGLPGALCPHCSLVLLLAGPGSVLGRGAGVSVFVVAAEAVTGVRPSAYKAETNAGLNECFHTPLLRSVNVSALQDLCIL